MDITKRIKNAFQAFNKTENAVGPDPNAFLRFGNNRRMPSTWSTPQINDEDFYSGLGWAVINKRANRTVSIGKKFLYTDAKEDIIKKANDEKKQVVHPYIDLIRNSDEFTQRDFWYDISTYLDLEGVYFLMAVRTVTNGGRVGNVQKFSLLNPYWVRQIINSDGTLGGYVENNPHKGQREIPKEMIIPIKLLNPFDPTQPYSLADAARDSQFTLKQANDFAREAIDGNLNAPGILSSAIELPDDQFDNFVDRVKNHGRGEPLFGNGSGTVSWVDMQTDLDKAALDKINTINRDALLAISGLSKTGIGVEESGTGREVSRTQKDDFTESAIMPQIENIIDALNLDYRKYYPASYNSNGYVIELDNPLEADRDAEQADVDIRDSQFVLMQSLISKGYTIDIAAKYAKGLVDITALGEPTEEVEPVVDPNTPVTPTDTSEDTPEDTPEETPPAENSATPFYENEPTEEYEGYPVPVLQYLSDELGNQIEAQSEKGSRIFSTKEQSKVIISHVAEFYQNLVGIVDDGTFVQLGEFKEGADRQAIIDTLNKRYKNQPVAVKKKIDSIHTHEHDVAEIIRNAAFDKQAQIDANTSDLLLSARAAEDKMYNWYYNDLVSGGDGRLDDVEQFVAGLVLPFSVYFTLMFPIYASHRVAQTSKDLNVNDQVPIVTMTAEVKSTIEQFAQREAESHINTIKSDIENALAVIRTQTSDPQAQRVLFDQAFRKIQQRRAITIANNAAKRIFNMSQYEADLQFLTRAGLVNKAFKVLFSLTGDPCGVCAYLISATNAKPIPFNQAFADLGTTLDKGGVKLTFNYEQITAGNVHPNCNCAYKLIVEDD